MATAQLGSLLRFVHKLAAGHGLLQRTDRELLDDFSARRDEVAFAALVARHGPMVLRVCQGALKHEQDTEDAFQATFLILARKCGSIHKREALAQWLHGVALRTAMEVKRCAARRRNHEARLWTVMRKAAVSPTWDDVQTVLDEEVQRLPESYRAAFVLCVLEGKSGPQAAAELGVKEGAIWTRLTRARQLLQRRLTRRGVKLAAVLAGLTVGNATQAGLPAMLAKVTIRFGLLVAAGNSAAGVIPTPIAALAAGVIRAMCLSKARIAIAVMFSACLLTAGVGVGAFRALAANGHESAPLAHWKASRPSTRSPALSSSKSQSPDEADPSKIAGKDPIPFSGRVLDPDGKPVSDAKLYVLYGRSQALPAPAACDAEGRFQFSIARNDFVRAEEQMPWEHAKVVAVARGYGLGVAPFRLGKPTPRTDLRVRLAKDDAPLNGRIVDLQGKPIAGVTVRVRGLHAPFGEDLAAFVKGVKDRKEFFPPLQEQTCGFSGGPTSRDIDSLFAPATTGADGRFEIKGIGRERMVELRIEGPAITTSLNIYATTRPADTIQAPGYKQYLPNTDLLTVHGNGFEYVATPCKPIVGVVRDKDTGKPIPGAIVTSYKRADSQISARTDLQAVTDREGRYRLMGMPKGEGNIIRAGPPDNEPYLMAVRRIADTPGFEPITADFTLKRGVWIAGRVLDKVTGAPLHAQVQYAVFEDNPNRKQVPGLSVEEYLATNAQDGKFRTVGLPGRGLIAARAWNDRYLFGVGADKIKGLESDRHFRTYPYLVYAQGFHQLIELNPKADDKLVTCDLLLDPGRTLKGKVLGPDGEPLAGAKVCGLRSYGSHGIWEYNPLQTSEFVVTGLAKGKTRLLQFVHFEKKLAGSLVLKGDDNGPVTVKLAAAGTVTGRLVTPEGEPIKDGELNALRGPIGEPSVVEENPAVGSLPAHISPDKDGKFRIQGVIPGLTYHLGYNKGNYVHRLGGAAEGKLTIKPGETKDLGDVVVKPIE
jgi:RNA polymerase sigma factor (sigma-70 family)